MEATLLLTTSDTESLKMFLHLFSQFLCSFPPKEWEYFCISIVLLKSRNTIIIISAEEKNPRTNPKVEKSNKENY